MKQAGPSITAPISRRKRTSRSAPVAMISAALATIFAIGGTFILATAVLSRRGVPDGSSPGTEGALRQSVSRNLPAAHEMDPANAQGLIIHTHLGDIRIHFTPELAGESSIEYVRNIVQAASAKRNSGMGYNTAETMDGRRITEGFMCQRCDFYRAEKDLLLQGVLADPSAIKTKVELGPCPVENYTPKLKCPEHDPNCGCHGPVMTKGMVGWAGGADGPDFFINTFKSPVDWWENQHTVWGQIRDDASMKVVESTYDLPAHMSGMRMLDQKIEFSIELF